jgi:flagellar hook-associated protein 3 FlgL
MRVSSGLMMGRYVKQINKSYENQAKLMEQSDGSNLHRPSDDSVKYSKYLRYQNSNTENLQYQDNVKAGISWMRTADAAAVNMTEIYTTLKENHIHVVAVSDSPEDIKYMAKIIKKACLDDIEEYHARQVRQIIKDVYGGIKYEPGSESNTNTDS